MRIRITKDNQIKQQPSGETPDDGLEGVNLKLTSSIQNLKARWRRWQAKYFESKTKRLF